MSGIFGIICSTALTVWYDGIVSYAAEILNVRSLDLLLRCGS